MNRAERLARKMRERMKQGLFWKAGQLTLSEAVVQEQKEKFESGRFGLLGRKNVPDDGEEE